MHKTSKRLLWIGLGPECSRVDSRRGLVLPDLPAVLLSRHRPPVARTAGGQGQEVRGAEPSAPQRYLQRAELGGRLHRPGSQRLAGRRPGHPFRRPAPAGSQRTARAVRAGPHHPGLPVAQRGVQSVITVVARPRVPGGNTVELTLEKIRAGILPVPADNVLDRIIEYARYHGVDAEWTRRDGYPVVLMRYTPNLEREDVQLEELQIRTGQIRLAGRSDRNQGRFPRPDPAVAQGASIEVSHAEDPRRLHAGLRPATWRRARPRQPVESPPASTRTRSADQTSAR